MSNYEQSEHEVNNHILEMGWKEGAATTDRLERLLNRLDSKYKLRLASVAIADTDLSGYDDENFELDAA